MKHTLLPQALQAQLVKAAATKNLAAIDAAVENARRQAPFSFHTDKSLETRVFFDEPRGFYSGDFINPAPARV